MIPFIRSFSELMAITESRDHVNLTNDVKSQYELEANQSHSKNNVNSKDKIIIGLPNLPKEKRRKWIRSKKAVVKFLDSLDYNNQIQSSYEITLIERQNKLDHKHIA